MKPETVLQEYEEVIKTSLRESEGYEIPMVEDKQQAFDNFASHIYDLISESTNGKFIQRLGKTLMEKEYTTIEHVQTEDGGKSVITFDGK